MSTCLHKAFYLFPTTLLNLNVNRNGQISLIKIAISHCDSMSHNTATDLTTRGIYVVHTFLLHSGNENNFQMSASFFPSRPVVLSLTALQGFVQRMSG